MTVRSSWRCIGPPLILLMAGPVGFAQTPDEVSSGAHDAPLGATRVREGAESQARYGDIYGYQLMTERERSEYRDRMRSAATDQDRERLRSEHHEQMQERARERGVSLSRPNAGSGSLWWPGAGSARRGGN